MVDPIFAQRRAVLLDAMGEGVLVLFAAGAAIRNNDVEHEYRQDSDFYYLTGFDEPESVLVLSTVHADRYALFVRPRDPERETWDGARVGVDGAVSELGAKVAFPVSELAAKLPDWLENAERLFYRIGRDRDEDEQVLRAIDRTRPRARRGATFPTQIIDPATLVHEMRRKKTPAEIELMARAIDITGEAHVAAMAVARPGMYEYEVEAVLRNIFRKHGSERPAYAPIVGSGPNATVLHYHKNNRLMEEGDLLLIDAGTEFGYYAADVTRTFPVGGKFTEPQREIYDLVLAAQDASIDATRPGATIEEIHAASVKVLAEGMVTLGLIEGPVEEAIKDERYKRYYMHKTSHYLGMDVHDVGRYFERGKPRPLEPGVVITVEPGLYVSATDDQAPARYRGIGVRIEDDVLVTAEGRRVLSDAIPRRTSDVERACRPS
ncbi:MAG TPA: aminopeptidase P N-terminal domain-containing protein [Polyangiaceae bacterium]|jgi:Xaa-Pro aminopeptidase|nr:aminopeptidase P N-terminal domain-containing protein [Polyangiaceae bacterium]